MIKAKYVDRESYDVRSSGNRRKRVDAYFVAYQCPADKFNASEHEWICRFEVERKSEFKMCDFESKEAARANCGYVI
jgi:hypothetical protein